MRILVSGRPGIGKTTLIKRLAERISGCGFYTEEVRFNGRRIGFDGVRIPSGERVILARVGKEPPRVGKYSVSPRGVETLIRWLENCKGTIYVDEIGPMELLHPGFGDAVLRSAERSNVFVGTVHRRIAREWANKLNAKLFWLTEENRERVFQEILRNLTSREL